MVDTRPKLQKAPWLPSTHLLRSQLHSEMIVPHCIAVCPSRLSQLAGPSARPQRLRYQCLLFLEYETGTPVLKLDQQHQ